MQWGTPPPEPPSAPKRSILSRFFPIAAIVVTVAYVALFLPELLSGWNSTTIILASSVLTMVVVAFPFTVLGAWIGARRSGLTVRKLGLGPVLVLRTDAGARYRFVGGWSIFMMQIALGDVPLDRLRAGMPDVLRGMVAGTVARGFAVVGLLLVVAGSAGSEVMSFYLYMSAAFFTAITLISTLPYMHSLRLLRKGGQEADALVAQWAVGNAIATGRRPRDWDPRVVAMLGRIPDTTINAVVPYSQVYFHYLDAGDIERASWFLNKAATIVEGNRRLRGMIVLPDMAYFTARYLNDAVEARRWLDNRKALMPNDHTRARITTAVLVAEARLDEARAMAQRGLRATEESFDPGTALMDADLLRGMLAEIDAIASAVPQRPTLAAW
jgi:hypothetical protein